MSEPLTSHDCHPLVRQKLRMDTAMNLEARPVCGNIYIQIYTGSTKTYTSPFERRGETSCEGRKAFDRTTGRPVRAVEPTERSSDIVAVSVAEAVLVLGAVIVCLLASRLSGRECATASLDCWGLYSIPDFPRSSACFSQAVNAGLHDCVRRALFAGLSLTGFLVELRGI